MTLYDYDFDEFIKTKYGGFFSLIIDDVFTPGDVRPEFAWIAWSLRNKKEIEGEGGEVIA